MAQVVTAFSEVLRTTDGTAYTVTACGRERSDGTWEGWLEFAPDERQHGRQCVAREARLKP
jgi:hypothetical protein